MSDGPPTRSPQPAAPDGDGSAARRRRPGVVDMVITMAVLLAAVAVILLLVPAPRGIVQPGVDPVGLAADAAEPLGFEPAAVAAEDLGEGWTASYARVEDQEGVQQWRLGYLSPDGRRVDVEQADDVTARWLARAPGLLDDVPTDPDADPVDALGEAGQEVELAGRTWVVVPRADGVRAFARREGEVVTVLSTPTEAGLGALEAVAAALDLD